MSESAADAGPSEFTHLWRSVSTLCGSKIQNTKKEQQMSSAETSPRPNCFQSPKAVNRRRFTGFNYGNSPGDVEPSQDIIWDSTSPTAAKTGHTRVVEISDLVKRIAPKEKEQQCAESALLQWIGDSISCTPDIPKQRARRKSTRHSNVEDLVKLARQFDKNMQDRESSEVAHSSNNNPSSSFSECGNTSRTRPRSADNMKELQSSSSSERVEAELQALFDCSTQRVSGRLSQGSSASACSQEVKGEPAAAHLERSRQIKSSEKSAPAAEVKTTALSSNNDFDDDWENDDLLNDPLLLELTHNPPQLLDKPKTTPQLNTKTEPHQRDSGLQSTTKPTCRHQLLAAQPKIICSPLQELCPKPKTTNRSTFKLEPNPYFRGWGPSKPALTAVPPATRINPTTTKTLSQPGKTTNSTTDTCDVAKCVQGFSDSLWDDGDDDTLLYQVCDSVERISNSQLDQASSSHKTQHIVKGRGQKCTTPMPIVTSFRAKPESPRSFVRSNSFPATSSGAVNYRGWDAPMKGANNRSEMSQSLPGRHTALGTFNQPRDSSGNVQPGNNDATKACMVTAKHPHTTFKRNFSDSAVTCNKVFVTSQLTGKCSATEIARKKQEALARRRQRMQNGPKP